ncbi:type I-B CRISPR-associated protein Cas7/Csh2 [Pueribacillus theae]|uniref:Type I-B CRISPR-associated protein Cas7/Csh2 n=1 Tax=Pueribacillus theae TaxID=2171751 RepID=A0A2U1K760_9BACI|nr:type I-B CRISPR-associated protein Cas7/Csh2 [Pueribacillus theae]PWA13095.1 type I-B CRISPR-associated protein Cas7/Csh2 [Pueribacillus theae]
MKVNNGELLFVKSVKDGIPNRDPLNDSDARRIFPEEDGRISLSDVSIKRDVRDFVVAMYPDGAEKNHVFVQAVTNDKGKLLGRKSLAMKIAETVGKEKEAKQDMKKVLIEHAFDVRTFGIVYSENPKFHLTGPVQFAWAHSMHPVDTHYVQGTVTMPSSDAASGGEEKSQGTIWTSYTLPFAVFSMAGVINAKSAEHTNMTQEDQELLIRGLWQGTQNRHARGRGQQEPLFLVHVEYNDPFYRIGSLEDMVKLHPEEDAWRQDDKRPSSIKEIVLDATDLIDTLSKQKHKIQRCRIWKQPLLRVQGNIEPYIQEIAW